MVTIKKFERIIPNDTPVEDLVWHRDEYDRLVTVLEGTDWYFQYEDRLPIQLVKDLQFFIKRMTYHRVIRGTDDLKLTIEESIY